MNLTKEVMMMKALSDKEAAEKWRKQKASEARYYAKVKIILRKAKAAGITVTDAEIDAELKG